MPRYPIVFISYDEPNAEANHLNLLKHEPWALRVHGVKGFDAAHKEAARVAQIASPGATHFFTVDGDTKLLPGAWQQLQTEMEEWGTDRVSSTFENKVLCWRSINSVNGLCYGNGGVKFWSINWVKNMRTHEASTTSVSTDFCWEKGYFSLEGILSTTHINHSPFQAWRSGFREGSKLGLDRGHIQDRDSVANSTGHVNINRLIAWASLGADVLNGKWCILGALQGFEATNSGKHDPRAFVDYDNYYPKVWDEVQKSHYGEGDQSLADDCRVLRARLRDWNIEVPVFGPLQSTTCKLLMEYYQPLSLLGVTSCHHRVQPRL